MSKNPKNTFIKYQVLWLTRRIGRKIFRQPIVYNVYGDGILTEIQEAEDMIAEWITIGNPFAVVRFGSVELDAVWRQDTPGGISKGNMNRIKQKMENNAGFFGATDISLRRYAELFKDSCGKADMVGCWFNVMEDYMIDIYGKSPVLTRLRAIEPWYVERPWTRALEGKKVLVIHPFAETIKKQYQNRERLFKNRLILPEFSDLYVLKAVQTIAGCTDDRFQNWFEALDWMYKEAMKVDFDVAIIGCGAYGFPLATKIKEAGKQAVHMGGATQLLFGIKGSRWDNHPVIGKLYNEYWTRPGISETPEKASAVEAGCYW